jgi:mono/diheme cytochrome c family protein
LTGQNGGRAGRFWCLAVALPVLLAAAAIMSVAFAAGDAQHGEAIYKQYCQGCHGAGGRGAGEGLVPHVGPLAKKGYIEKLPDNYLAAVIAEGGAAAGKSAFMPAWKTTLSGQNIADVIAYIRTFAPE